MNNIKILNDYSVDNQFNSIDDFLDSLFDYTIPLLESLNKYNIGLTKSHEIFNRKIVSGKTLLELFQLRGSAEIAKIKDIIFENVIAEPYWEEEFEGQDCLSKACSQGMGMISFEHDKFKKTYVNHSFNKQTVEIENNFKATQLLEHLYGDNLISIREYLKEKHKRIYDFCMVDDKDYFQVCVTKDKLSSIDFKTIVDDLDIFMRRYNANESLGRFSDNIEQNLHEFRTTISDAREFRILYCICDSKIAFLNCFIKKQETTPEREKEMGRKLRDKIIGK